MIGRLRGEVVVKQAPHLLLDVGGVGYEIEAPMSTFYDLPSVGAQVTLFTHLLVREDAHTLYGFATDEERRLFRGLLKVNGVGAKVALAILSGMSVDAFVRCVQDGAVAALTRVPGIGKRTAERLIVEMRDRMQVQPPQGGSPPSEVTRAGAGPTAEAIAALVALGYRQVEAERLVRGVGGEGRSSEDLIRAALQAVSRG